MKAESTTSNGSTCLIMATLNRSRQKLQYVIENFPEQLNVVNSDGMNCLLMSCVRDNIHIFELLVKTGISLEHRDKTDNTCLMTAIAYRNNCLARFIVENYPKHLYGSDESNALMLCCRVGNIEMFKFLIVTWMDSDPIFEKGMTSLMVAVRHKQRRIAKYIAAVLQNQLHLRNDDGWDALLFCSMYGDIELFDFLIKQGMNPHTQTQDGLSCLMSAVRNRQLEITRHIINTYPEQLHQSDQKGMNVLHYCCQAGDIKLFRYLVEKGLTPDTGTFDGSTCLMIAVANKQLDLAQHLVDKYSEQLEQRDQNGWNVLLYCSKAGDQKIFDYLVAKGVKPDTCASNGSTCLMISVLNKEFDLTKHIVDKYPEQLEQIDQKGWDVLLCCCKAGDVRIFDYLVGKGVKPDARSSDGLTSLIIAVLNKHFDLTRCMVDKYPEQLELQSLNGCAVLLWCFLAGDLRTLDYLLREGVKPDTCTTDRLICLIVAILNNQFGLIRQIVDKYPELLEQRKHTGCYLLLCCCEAGDVTTFDYLIGKGVKPDGRFSDGLTCLMIATMNKHFDLIRHIVDKYPEQLEQRDKTGFDVLLCCCQGGDVRIFDYLVGNGVKTVTRSSDGSTCLMIASLHKHFDLTRHIVDKYPEQLEQQNKNGDDALFYSCLSGDVRIFDYIVGKGGNPDTRSSGGSTWLIIATKCKYIDLIRHIVDKYPEQLEQQNKNGDDALFYSCLSGDVRIFDYIDGNGSNPDPRSSGGMTWLIISTKCKYIDLIRHIVDKYPEQLEQRNKNVEDALFYSCKSGDVRIFDYLVGKGGNPDTRSSDGLTCLMIAIKCKHIDLIRHVVDKYPEQLEQRDKTGFDVLFCCCQGGDVRIFDYLVGNGVKPVTRSSDGLTCLMIASLHKHFDLTRHIVDKYPEQLEQRNKYGDDALFYSCLSGDVRIFDYIVGKGGNPDTRSYGGLTYLIIATKYKYIDLIRHIVDKYPEQLEQRDKTGFDVLLCCCQGGDVRIFDYLVGKGVKPDGCSSDGSTCLMIAAMNKHFDLTRHIVDKYPEQLEQRDKTGFDVLLCCCQGGDVRIFDYLVGKGVKPDGRSSDGSTCLMIAAMNKHFDLTRHIVDKYPEQLEQQNKNGVDALVYSCLGGDVRIFDYLVGKGVKPDGRSSDGSTCLMIAAMNKHFDLTRHIVDKYPEQLEQQNKNGVDALVYSCLGGDVRIFDYLVGKGVKPDRRSSDGLTCLMIATKCKHIDLIRHIVDKYPEQLEQRDKTGFDVLLCCCQGGDVRIFDYLVGKGVKPDGRSSDGSTCLMIAAMNKHFDLTRHIVDKYPEQLEQRDKTGFDVLLCCCQGGDVRIFDYLVGKGVKPDGCSSDGSTCLMIAAMNKHFDLTRHIVDKYPEQLEQRDKTGFDVLLCCCQGGDVRIFDYLVGKGVKPDGCSSDGSTCLMIAAMNKHFDLTRHIVDKYPEQLEQRDKTGFDVLLCCCQGGDVRIFDYLVGKGVKPDGRSSDGSTCLMIAAMNKHFDLTRHIVDKYPEQLEQQNKNGVDALVYSCLGGDVRIFDYLVGKGVKPDRRSSDGLTCLMIATKCKHIDLIRHIVDKYPEQLEQRDKTGFDVLLCCCQGGDVRIFDYLVGKGVKPDGCSSDGSTCLMIAAMNKHFDLTRHIVDKYPEQLEQRDKTGFDVLLCCCQGGDVRIFDYLVGKGVKPDGRSSDGLTCLMIASMQKHFDLTRHIVDKYPQQLEQRDKNGVDALVYSCKSGDVRIFDYIDGKGVKPDGHSSDGLTYLMIAAMNKQFDLTRHIVDKYPEQLEQRDKNGVDALVYSCKSGDVRIFDYIDGKGVKPDGHSSDGLTCLMIAAMNKQFDLTRHIVDKYPEQLEQRDKNGVDALVYSCQGGDVRIFDYLVGKGVKPDGCSSDGSTCLMIAAMNKHFDLTRHIVDKYPEQLKQQNKNGVDALVYSYLGGDVRIFDYLVGKGVKTDVRSSDGLTCLMIASMNNHFDLTRHVVDRYPEQVEERDAKGFDALLSCCIGGVIQIFEYLVGKGVKAGIRSFL
ncbi:Ankyrin-1 [Mizuhopecten yessoensis]|uniref:Ankyrin-1 n=1 Tax=Mizuhopecten yessoensis TaxID=6573 RepID=A0A210Q934_MIZYE|nr:Ankyrin-1 [Mizuhopecten yessoensis]